ncbi:MAG: amino acid permease [Ignavibacteria bacterium]|jgi:APA family basic amino acid/polyamine antiporter
MKEEVNPADNSLQRKISFTTATSIVIANMIGAGIFTTSGIMAGNLPDSGWVILCWFFGGMLAIAGALCYSELSTRMPADGGEYIYLRTLYHPLAGFLTGWTSFIVGFSVPVAASAIGFSSYMFGGMNSSFFIKVSAIVIIIVFTVVHYTGVKIGSKVQNWLTLLKIILVLGLAIAGFLFGKGDWSQITFSFSGSFEGMAIGTAMMLTMFSYSGWNASSYIAGEIENPRRNLPASLLTGTVIVMVIYLGLNLFIFYSVPFNEIKGVITVVEAASVNAFGQWIGETFGIIISLALLSSLSAYIIIGPRVYYAMSKHGHFFKFASEVHSRFKVPGKSILIQGTLAIVMITVGSFEQLLVYLGFSLSIFPLLAVAGIFIARKRKIGENTAVKVWGYPFVPVFFLTCSFLLMVVAFINRPAESTIAIATVLLGIPFYYLWIKRNSSING